MIDTFETKRKSCIIFTPRAKLSHRFAVRSKKKMDEISFRRKILPREVKKLTKTPQRSRRNAFFFSRNSVTMLQSAKTMGTMMHRPSWWHVIPQLKTRTGCRGPFPIGNGEAGVRPIAGESRYAPCGLPSPPTAR